MGGHWAQIAQTEILNYTAAGHSYSNPTHCTGVGNIATAILHCTGVGNNTQFCRNATAAVEVTEKVYNVSDAGAAVEWIPRLLNSSRAKQDKTVMKIMEIMMIKYCDDDNDDDDDNTKLPCSACRCWQYQQFRYDRF